MSSEEGSTQEVESKKKTKELEEKTGQKIVLADRERLWV